MRAVLKYLPARWRGVYWAALRESYETAAHVTRFAAVSRRRRLARDWQGRAAVDIPAAAGFVAVAPGRFSEVDAIVDEARATVERFDASDAGFARKEHLTNLLDASTLTLKSPYLQFALRDDLLAAIAAYLGVVPVLNYVGLWYSRNITRPPYSSQLYHRDGEGRAQVKIFVFCRDVTADNGPLTVVRGDASERVSRQLSYGRSGGRLADADVRGRIAEGDEVVLTGPSGTCCFVDTDRCFHYGSRVGDNAPPRLVAMFQYVRPTSFRCRAPFQKLIMPDMPVLHRLVLQG